jgi:hypothetical protein
MARGRARSYRIDGLLHLFTNGSGDFTLLSRDLYFRPHGIPEEREFHSMHFHSIFCFMAHAAGAVRAADQARGVRAERISLQR